MPQFEQVVAATYDRVNNAKNKAENVWSENATLKFFEQKGALKRVPGSNQLEFTIDTAANPDAGFVATDMATLSTTKTEVLDAVKYDWALGIVPITWSILDEAKNSGEQKVDLVTSIVDNAFESHDTVFETGLFAASSTNGFLSLPVILTEDGLGTIAGTNSATDTWWANEFEDYGTDLHLGLHIATAECAKGTGGSTPDLYITSPLVWATYADNFQSNLNVSSLKSADAGVQTLKFAGQDMIFSNRYTSGGADTVFLINTKTLKIYVIRDYYRQRRSNVESISTASMHMKVVSVAQIATSDRSRSGCCFT